MSKKKKESRWGQMAKKHPMAKNTVRDGKKKIKKSYSELNKPMEALELYKKGWDDFHSKTAMEKEALLKSFLGKTFGFTGNAPKMKQSWLTRPVENSYKPPKVPKVPKATRNPSAMKVTNSQPNPPGNALDVARQVEGRSQSSQRSFAPMGLPGMSRQAPASTYPNGYNR